MSDGGVSRGEVQSIVNSAVSSSASTLRGEIKNAKREMLSELKTVERDLGRKIRELEKQVSDLWKGLGYVEKNLENLMREITASFGKLDTSVANLTTETRERLLEVADETREGTQKVVTGLKESEETARTGLDKVSSGAALADMLHACADADEAAIGISKAIADIDERNRLAEAAAEALQRRYDEHIKKAVDGLEENLQRVGEHIFETQDTLQRALEELTIDEARDARTSTTIKGVFSEFTKHRTRKLSDAWGAVDYTKLKEFEDLFAQLLSLKQDLAFVRKEVDHGAGTDAVPPAFGLPVICVQLANGRSDGQNNVLALGARVANCYRPAEFPPGFDALRSTIQGMCDRLEPNSSEDDTNNVAAIRTGLSGLVEKGLLNTEHAHLIEEHLDSYPMKPLDS